MDAGGEEGGARVKLYATPTRTSHSSGSSCCQGKQYSELTPISTSFLRVSGLGCRSDAACTTTLARQNRRWWGGPPLSALRAKGPALGPRGAASSEAEARVRPALTITYYGVFLFLSPR